jgi:hypothetical protein
MAVDARASGKEGEGARGGGPRPRQLRTFAFGGMLAFALAMILASVFDYLVGISTGLSTWWGGAPGWLAYLFAALAFVVYARGIRRMDLRWELAAYGIAAAAFGPLADATPTTAAWMAGALAAGAFLVAVESGSIARRLAKLLHSEEREAHLERIARPLQLAIFGPLAAILVALLVAPFLGRAALGLAGAGVGASLEAEGIFGAAAGALLLTGIVAAAAFARHQAQRSR